ncbi:creatininase family protein [Enterovirga aerilata]|uniref:Creatininase family protein n=1 Tax=Enterovirga aerilata TaxID=2730920 RepID=A0A849HVM4_9HYPH|nr:creatininase family protein [Enterovirga sp. DB1703]NNM71162.1 creatininase family protein [Enterovirga sp. DB1703]
MTASVLWRELTAAQLRGMAEAGALVLLPVASTEQHGPHLATGVDDILCSDICRRVGEALVAAGKPALVAPTLWCGLAEHHVAFGGSFTLTLPTYHALLRDLCRSILRAGFRQILIVNGHGGNMSALAALTVELTRELEAPIATTTYFLAAQEEFAQILQDQRAVLHACEAETSMMMVVRPDLVDASRLPEATGRQADSPSAVLSPVLNRWRSFRELTETGVLGDARRSTPEKGERLIRAVVDGMARQLLAGEPWA